MAHILAIYPDAVPTVALVMGVLNPAARLQNKEVVAMNAAQVKAADIDACDSLLAIRPWDVTCTHIISAARKCGKHTVIYLDDDLLHVPNLYASLPRKFFAMCLKERNKKALINALACCEVLWGSNPILLERYRPYVTSGRCALCDVAAEISHMKPPVSPAAKTRILFAGATDHASLLNRYVIPALNLIADYFPNMEMTCIGVNNLDACQVPIRFIPWFNDYAEYRLAVQKMDFDIGIAVIDDAPFYHCKYFNKFIEYSMLGMVGIYTASPPYTLVVKHNENGFLAEANVKSWADAIAFAARHPDERKTCVQNAQAYLQRRFGARFLQERLISEIPELFADAQFSQASAQYHPNVIWGILRETGMAAVGAYEHWAQRRTKS